MNPKPQCPTCTTASCFIKRGCNAKWQEELTERKTSMNYKKGQHVLLEGNPILGIYFIFSGKIKVVCTGYNDREQIVRLTNSGDILGHRAAKDDFYTVSAIAFEDSHICFLENNALSEVFIDNPNLTYLMMMYYSEELRKTETRIKILAQMNVREKVAEALLFLQAVYGNKNEKKEIIDLKMGRQDIADIAGINADQASREISEYNKEGVITTKGKGIIITDRDKLEDIIRPFTI